MFSHENKNTAALPTIVPVRPMLMLTGFLGAGKTTLLREILSELLNRGLQSDVILNDRENASIDQDALQGHAASVEALSGSCVCCDGMDALYEMILKASKSIHQLLLIELNGTADPLPLQEGFTLLESKFLLHPRWQVCVIDARKFGRRSQFNELEKLQLETASHYYLSHTTNLIGEEENDLELEVEKVNPHASRTSAFALAHSLSQAINQNKRYLLAKQNRKCEVNEDSALFSKLTKPSSLHDRHHLAHEFTGISIVIPHSVEAEQVITWMELLPESVIRAKALVNLLTEPNIRYLYERVGMTVTPRAIPVRFISKAPCSGLFIGSDLQPDEILHLTQEKLHPDCYLSQ